MKLIAKKSLGQHFLNSRHALDQIISAASMQKGEVVLEIGPGTGVLTQALLDTGAHVIAVEKDDRAFGLLKEKFSNGISKGRLNVVHGDILELSKPQLESLISSNAYSLVANIPYYITGAILEKFLEHGPRPGRMVLLVQKEVADRIIAADGKESILSISVKAFGTPKMIAKVPRGAFTPPPNVDSAILSISEISDKRFSSGNIDMREFFNIVRAGFAHKRKFVLRNLESIRPAERLKTRWIESKFDEKMRAEELSIEKWLEIAKCE